MKEDEHQQEKKRNDSERKKIGKLKLTSQSLGSREKMRNGQKSLRRNLGTNSLMQGNARGFKQFKANVEEGRWSSPRTESIGQRHRKNMKGGKSKDHLGEGLGRR